jgi:hypothetical protein
MIHKIKVLFPRPGYMAVEWALLGSIIVCADLVTQKIEHINSAAKSPPSAVIGSEKKFAIDYSRLKGVAVTSLGFLSPLALMWYPFLHRLMARRFSHMIEGTLRYVVTKTAIENVLLPAPVCFGYFVITAAVEGGHQWEALPGKLKNDLIPSVAADTAFWCFLSPMNYRFVPLKFQPLFSCVVDGLEAAGLSYLTHCDDFKWSFTQVVCGDSST